MSELRAHITGAGMYVPPKIVKNKDIEKLMNTSDEWITQRSGIEERHWVDKDVTTTSLAVKASLAAIKDAKKNPQDIDAIIFATLSPDFYFPGCGVLLQKEICPEKTVPALDVRNQCSGFLYSLSIADGWIKSGQYKCILVVGAEIHSTGIDQSPEGRDVGVLFGDGAGAVIIEPTTKGNGIIVTKLHSEGQYAEKLWLQRPSSADFNRVKKGEQELDRTFFPAMDGKFVFKHAITRMCEVLVEVTASQNLKPKDIDFLIAHQANMRINTMVMEQLKIPLDRTLNTIQKYGNTTSATIPIGIHAAKEAGLLKPGQLVGLVAFGSGFTWGASLIRI